MVGHKRNENAVAGFGTLNFPGAYKSATAEVNDSRNWAYSFSIMTLLNSNFMIIKWSRQKIWKSSINFYVFLLHISINFTYF